MRHKETSLNSVVVLRNKKKWKNKEDKKQTGDTVEQKYEIEQTRSNLELHYQH